MFSCILSNLNKKRFPCHSRLHFGFMKNFLTFFKPVFITSIYNKYYPIWLKKGKNTQTIKPQLHCYSNWGIQVMSEERLNRRQRWPAFSFINHISGIVLQHLQEFSNFTALSLRSNHFTHVAIHVLMLSLFTASPPLTLDVSW